MATKEWASQRQRRQTEQKHTTLPVRFTTDSRNAYQLMQRSCCWLSNLIQQHKVQQFFSEVSTVGVCITVKRRLVFSSRCICLPIFELEQKKKKPVQLLFFDMYNTPQARVNIADQFLGKNLMALCSAEKKNIKRLFFIFSTLASSFTSQVKEMAL